MQQFTVPQFIDVEDKIIGPITSRQFLILMAGSMLIGLFWKILDFSAFAFFSSLNVLIFGTFAFVRINAMPFHFFMLNFLQTLKRPSLRVWNKSFGKDIVADEPEIIIEKEVIRYKTGFSSSRLNELSLIVDTQGSYKGEKKEGGADVRLVN